MSGEHQEAIALEVEKAEQRKRLNSLFRDGCFAFEPEMVKLLCQSEFPIVVDFNNVLVNNNLPLIANPEAKKFLDELSRLGEIFVVTTAGNWLVVWRRLEQFGLAEKVVLMVRENYYRRSDEWGRNQRRLVDAFVNRVIELGLEEKFGLQETPVWKELRVKPQIARRYLFGGSASSKCLAPIFQKSFAVPIIDDACDATLDNPGMLGFQAPYFEPRPNDWEAPEELNAGRQSLMEIAAAIKKYKDSIR